MSIFDQPKIDTHHHVFDPANFPYIAETAYRPAGHEIGTVDDYQAVMQAYNIRHSLIVGPTSGYNTDSSCLLDALAKGNGRFKGIAVVPFDSSLERLAELKQAGVVGIALNVAMLGVEPFINFDDMMGKLAELDMFAAIQVQDDQLLALMPMLARTHAKLLIDHSGRPDVSAGIQQPAFQALLSLAATGRCWVKLSGLSKFSKQTYPYSDGHDYQLALLEAFGADRCMWGSDWPFLRAEHRMDIGTLLMLVDNLFPDKNIQRKIMWETPKQLFGFED
jgi:predicted TIM-barrel fold metal-dependent hydrolase